MESYSLNEVVYAKDGPLIYEAKVIQVADFNDTTNYRIHYQGWKSRYDEWVEADCLLKYTDSNSELKIKLKKEFNAKNVKKATTKRKARSLPNVKPQKRLNSLNVVTEEALKQNLPFSIEYNAQGPKTFITIPIKKIDVDPLAIGPTINVEGFTLSPNSEYTLERDTPDFIDTNTKSPTLGAAGDHSSPESHFILESDQNSNASTLPSSDLVGNPLECENQNQWDQTNEGNIIPMPDVLKAHVRRDFEILKGKENVVRLPANPSIEQLLSKYVENKSTMSSGEDISDVEEFVRGVKEYFNVLVDQQLLYRFEKKRHAEVKRNNKGITMSSIYGTIHFLRMFTVIGPFIQATIHDDNSLQLLIYHFCELLNYIEQNSTMLLKEDMYVKVSAAKVSTYYRKSF